ncbi:unnamed protein product [Rhizophagus irregularis]|nr:unnamed protein product [Rhizophagus irregularis]
MLNHLKAWGQVVAIKFKSQQKYVTVTVSIELNQVATELWNEGVWTAPLGGLPVRWFPANWNLKQRKEQERFQAVLKGVPASVTTAALYPDNPAHSILVPLGCKAFKIIQDRGTRKLITYYESWADLEKVLGKAFSLDEFTGDWMRYFTPNLKQRRRNPQKVNQEGGSKVRTTNTNTQSSKKQKVTKEIKNIDKALGGIDKLTVLAEIRSMLRKLGGS